MAIALDGTRDGVVEQEERAVRIQKGGDDERAKKIADDQPLLQRSVFPWIEVEGEEQAFVGEHFDTTTPYEVASHFGVPEVIFESFLTKEIHEAESCWGLPFTLLMVASYIGMMISHHDAATVFSVQSSMIERIEKKGLYRYSSPTVGWRNLHDISSYYDFYSWLHQGFFPLIMESEIAPWEIEEDLTVDWSWKYTTMQSNTTSTTSTSTTTTTQDEDETTTTMTTTSTTSTTWLAKDPSYIPLFHRIVGGIRFSQERSEHQSATCKGSEELVKAYGKPCVGGLLYELDPDPLGARQTRDPQRIKWFWVDDNMTTTNEKLFEMETEGWLDRQTQKVEIAIASYNGEYGIHSLVTINLYFNRAGHIWKRIIPESIFAEQFPAGSTRKYVFDITWMACLVYIFLTEALEMYHVNRRVGCGWEFVENYVNIWNVVDIFSVLYGVTIVIVAIMASRLVGELNDTLEKIGSLDGSWYGDEVATFRDESQSYYEYIEYLLFLANRCRILFACYPWVIAARLLKAFAAQPRLALVTRTLFHAWEELLHLLFVIVFVYAAFIMSGMILFSTYMHDFATVSRAFFTSFRCMTGDFEWPELVQPGRWETMVWFLSFQVVNFFCFLNMMLVILMGAYGDVKESLSSADTMWDEVFQAYERWVGQRRGEMVPLLDIVHAIVEHRHLLKVLHDPETNSTLEDKLRPFASKDGSIRLVTIDFLRNNVMKMRTAQARTLLEDSIIFFYNTNKTHSHVEQMSLVMHEMKHLHATMSQFMTGGDDSSDSDFDAEGLDRQMGDILEEQKKAEIERTQTFAEELLNCRHDLTHANLWVGTETIDEYGLKHGKLERGNSSSRLQNPLYAEGPDDGAILEFEEEIELELKVHRELESEIRQLEDQKVLAKKLSAKAVRSIETLEPQLLKVTEETSEIATRFHDLKRRVLELEQEQKRLDHTVAKGKKDMNMAMKARHDTFDLVHQLSVENEALTRELTKVRRERIAAAAYTQKDSGFLNHTKVHIEPELDVVREVLVEAARLKEEFFSRMLEHAEKAAGSRGAGQVPEIMRLLTTIQSMKDSKKIEYVDMPAASNKQTGERTFVYLPKKIKAPDDPGKLPEGQRFKKLFVEYGDNAEKDEDITICSV